MRTVFLICFWAPLFAAAETILPAGTELFVRLSTPVSSNSSKVDQPVEAVTITPVLSGSEVMLPAGMKIIGKIAETKASIKADERASLRLQFNDLGGSKATAVIVDVDNARERVDETGQI